MYLLKQLLSDSKTLHQDEPKTEASGTKMMIDLTKPFRLLRETRVEERQLRQKLIIEYVSRQPKSMCCSLCYTELHEEGLLCWSCFHGLYPRRADLKTSVVVECALALSLVRDKTGMRENMKLHDTSAPREFERTFPNHTGRLSIDEKNMMRNIKQKIHRTLMNKWVMFQYQSRMEVIDEQYSIMRLKYLLCLRKLKIDTALILKTYMIELKRDREYLAMLLDKLLIQ